jgi:hypothetical protein
MSVFWCFGFVVRGSYFLKYVTSAVGRFTKTDGQIYHCSLHLQDLHKPHILRNPKYSHRALNPEICDKELPQPIAFALQLTIMGCFDEVTKLDHLLGKLQVPYLPVLEK